MSAASSVFATSPRAEPQLALAVLWDLDDPAGLERLVRSVEGQTLGGLRLVVGTTLRKLRLPASTLDVEIRRQGRETMAARLSTLSQAARRPYVAVLQPGGLLPSPFFNELATFAIARFSPDLLFFEQPAGPLRSFADQVFTPTSCFLAGLPAPVVALRRGARFPDLADENAALTRIRPAREMPPSEYLNAPDYALATLPPSVYGALWRAVLAGRTSFALSLGGLIESDHEPYPRDRDDHEAIARERALSKTLSERRRAYRTHLLGSIDLDRFKPATAMPFRTPEASGGAPFTERPGGASAAPSLEPMRPKPEDLDDAALVATSGLFDAARYLAENDDVRLAEADPLDHFLRQGGSAGRRASLRFDCAAYLHSYPDVREAGFNPLVHYLRSGRSQGRSRWCWVGEVPPAEEALLRQSDLFDPAYYLATNGDLDPETTDPYWHYIQAGGRQGRAPSAAFSARRYLWDHADVRRADQDPLIFYLREGRARGDVIRPAAFDAWDVERHGPARVLDRVEWDLDAKIDPSAAAWLASAPIRQGGAELLCCVPYAVQDFLILRVLDEVHRRGVPSLLAIQDPTPAVYRQDQGPWSKRPERVLRLYAVAEARARSELLTHLIRSRGIRTLLLAGAFDIYPLLPRLKKLHPDLRVLDQLFNPVGHTRASLTFAPHIDGYVVESAMMRDFLTARDIPAERVHLVASGVDLRRFAAKAIDPDAVGELRRSCGLAPSVTMVVGFVGRLAEEKNPLGFLEIACMLASLRPEIGFVIGGSGPEGQLVRERARERLPEDRLAVLGFVEDVRHAMALCDILVVPSKVDGRPAGIMEANALGIPVVGSAVGGIPELIAEGVNGFLVRPGAYGDAARLIAGLAEDRSRLAAMSIAAREHAAAAFDQERMFADYTELFRSR